MPQDQGMPDELRVRVQRMIDAGESEDNIGSIIKAYKSGQIKTSSAPDYIPPKPSLPGIPTFSTKDMAAQAIKQNQDIQFNNGEIPTTRMGGITQSLQPGGTASDIAIKNASEYAKGAVLDLPQTMLGAAKLGAGLALPKPATDILGIPKKDFIDVGQDLWNGLKQIPDAYSRAATDPTGAWGRSLGQITGQGPVTEALIGGFPKGTFGIKNDIPSGADLGARGVRAVGGPLEKVGDRMTGITDQIYSHALPPKIRWPAKIAGSVMSGVGGWMKDFGLTTDQINTIANNKFWGESATPGTPRDSFGPYESPTSSTQSNTPDVWDEALKANARNLFNSPAENPLTSQFNRPIPQGTDLGFNPATAQEPHLPFDQPQGPPIQQGLIEDPTFTPNPRLAKVKKYTISEATPLKIAEGRRNGFEPVGEVVMGQPVKMARPTAPAQGEMHFDTPDAPAEPTETTEELPDKVSMKGLSKEKIDEWKAKGYTAGISADGFGQLNKSGGILKRFMGEDTGSADFGTAWKNLRQLLGHDPSATDLEQELSKSSDSLSVGATEQPSGQGQLFPMDLHTRSQLDNISRAGDFKLTPPPESGVDPNQGEMNFDFDPRSDDPNQMKFPRRQFTTPTGFKMSDFDTLNQNLKQQGPPLHGLGRGYAQDQLNQLRFDDKTGGPPGLTVKDDGFGRVKSYDLTYRDSNGKIIGHARASNTRNYDSDELHSGTFVVDEKAGLGQGKAALAMMKKMKELGVKGASGLYSKYTAYLPESLKRFADDYPPDYVPPENAPVKPKPPKGGSSKPEPDTNFGSSGEFEPEEDQGIYNRPSNEGDPSRFQHRSDEDILESTPDDEDESTPSYELDEARNYRDSLRERVQDRRSTSTNSDDIMDQLRQVMARIEELHRRTRPR
jgi:hypothetical protein